MRPAGISQATRDRRDNHPCIVDSAAAGGEGLVGGLGPGEWLGLQVGEHPAAPDNLAWPEKHCEAIDARVGSAVAFAGLSSVPARNCLSHACGF